MSETQNDWPKKVIKNSKLFYIYSFYFLFLLFRLLHYLFTGLLSWIFVYWTCSILFCISYKNCNINCGLMKHKAMREENKIHNNILISWVRELLIKLRNIYWRRKKKWCNYQVDNKLHLGQFEKSYSID